MDSTNRDCRGSRESEGPRGAPTGKRRESLRTRANGKVVAKETLAAQRRSPATMLARAKQYWGDLDLASNMRRPAAKTRNRWRRRSHLQPISNRPAPGGVGRRC